MALSVLGIGTEIPPYSISQAQAARIAQSYCSRTKKEGSLVDALYRRTGIQKRGSVLLQENDETQPRHPFFSLPVSGPGPTTKTRMEYYASEAALLSQGAAKKALGASGVSGREITHLITVSCTGFSAPGADIHLIKRLDLSPAVSRTHIGFMGCHGAFNGLRVARAFAEQDPRARILLAAVELCSLHFHFGWDPEKIVANGLFADGAASLVAGPNKAQDESLLQLLASGSFLFPDSEDAMTWKIGDHGFEMTLSARVPALIDRHLRSWLEGWLKENDLRIEDIRSWAVHPGGPRILDAVRKSLSLRKDALRLSEEVLADHGNMSSATILFILKRIWSEKAPRPCVALGFGPGLVAEAALFI